MGDRIVNQFPNLLSPLVVTHPGGSMEIRNRVLVSAHVPGFAENNKPGQQYIAYHRRYASEGVGLQITGGTPVHRSGMLSLAADGLWNLDDSVIPGYQQLSTAVHNEGGRILAQLAHSGGTVPIDQVGMTNWSASDSRSAITGAVAHAMTQAEIQEVIKAHVAATRRVREGGLDGVEILAAFGFLPQAFLSPLTNHRTDRYGGTAENRSRFLLELLTAVREVLGPEQILGVRLPGDEFESGGLGLEDMKAVCRHLEQLKLVDYINVIAHTNFTHTGRSKHWAPTPTPHGVFVDLASAIKTEVSVPVFSVGRIVDPHHAERIIANGQADMVGMTRAHICDPTIVSKITCNQPETIRPCVGANTCISKRYNGKTIRCMHNPELKSPGAILQPAIKTKSIGIIGAGPAGVEAARLCALRGHSVSLFEATDHVGGQLAYWARSTSMTELGKIISWRKNELKRLNVTIHLNSELSPDDLTGMEFDQLIIATGAKERVRALPGDQSIPVFTPTQLLDLEDTSARSAIVVNDGRGQAGLVAAEWLQERGVTVEIVTEDIAVANDLDPTNRNAWYQRLGQAGAVLTPQLEATGQLNRTLQLKNVFTQFPAKRENIDLLVDWSGSRSIDLLLTSKITNNLTTPLLAIGDCLAPRTVEVAMAEALRVANTL